MAELPDLSDTDSSLQWSHPQVQMSNQGTKEEGPFQYLIFFLTILLRQIEIRMEHRHQRRYLLPSIDHRQNLAHLLTICHTKDLAISNLRSSTA